MRSADRARCAAAWALVALAMLGACGRAPAPARHLLLVTLDTTRADRLGCYGRRDAGTPWLDALAARGARWERVYVSAPLTLPSHMSILTGLHPPHTGVRDNGDAQAAPGVRTLADRLAAAGFFTAAAVGGRPVAGRVPVRNGFAAFDDRLADPRHPEGLERDAARVVDAALALAPQRGGRRLFLWVHLYDAHDPYDPPSPFKERFAADPYQGEIASADAALAGFLPRLEQALGGEPLLVAVIGDHGEALGEHGELTHGFFVYDGTLRAPLIIAGPRVPAGQAAPDPVQAVDLVPTLLELLGQPVPSGLDGAPLLPASAARARRSILYAETVLPLRRFGWSPLFAAIDGPAKFIEAPRPELYDLARDPGETNDEYARRPERAAKLAAFVAGVRGGDGAARAGGASRDPALWSLGYVSSGAAPRAGAPLADPKDRLPVYREFQDAELALEKGDGAAALRIVGQFGDEARSPGALFLRGRALAMTGRVDEALAVYDELARTDAEFPGLAREQGRLRAFRGQGREALALLDRAVAQAPDDLDALVLRGAARELVGDAAGAEADYRQALAQNPAARSASLRLAALLLKLGRTPEARSVLQEHLRLFPDDQLARGLLGEL